MTYETDYHKPFYDPLEVFQPSKAFLREVIKQIKQECYELLKTIRDPEAEVFKEINQARHRKLVQRIQYYEFWIRGASNKNGINLSDIQRAKQRPISEFYTGKLARSAGRLLGKCPFHEDDKPSFVIYVEQNKWHCFGCSEGSDVIDFVCKLNGLKFLEAVKFLLNS